MLDRLEVMSILLDVAEKGSFSSVARDRRIPLPTVSRKVAQLERHLGAKVFTRSTRKLALTDAGEAYVAATRRILDQVRDAEARVAGEFNSPSGELIVTAPLLFGRLHVLPIVNEFLAAYPAISARLLLTDGNAHLIDEHIDMAVRIGPLPDSSMVASSVGTTRLVVCASPKLLAAHGTPALPPALASLPLLSFDKLTADTHWTFRDPDDGTPIGVTLNARLSVSTAEAAVAAAIAGTGATRVLHYQCVDAVRDGLLNIILPRFEPEPLPVRLLHPQRETLPLKTRAFLDFAATRLKTRLQVLNS